MNSERTEIADIDIDLAAAKRPLIIKRIKEERSTRISSRFDEQTKQNLGCTLVATFGTESSKATVLTSCRGYRSAEYPDGIDIDVAQYLSSLIPAERGEVWSLEDVLYGNEEKGRKPIKSFINEVSQYEGLVDIMLGIKDLVSRRGSHASGVVFFDSNPYEHCAFMKTPKGELITQWDLREIEWMGNTKYDFLITNVTDKILRTINLLQEAEEIEPNLSLREAYNKYLHPSVLPIHDEKIWDAIDNNRVIDLFQLT